MGNSSSSSTKQDDFTSDHMDDFEPIDKPASPTFMSSAFAALSPNDLATSGILVDLPPHEDAPKNDKTSISRRRIIKGTPKEKTIPTATAAAATVSEAASVKQKDEDEEEDAKHHHHHELPVTALGKSQQSDTEILQESLEKDKGLRLQKLQTDQKSKRNKAVEERRKQTSPTPADAIPSKAKVQPNPFSRFLSVFSVEPQFPSHKRRYEPSESELMEQPAATAASTPESLIGEPTKRPKLDPSAAGDNEEEATSKFSAHVLVDWLDQNLPAGWPWMAAAATAVVALVLVSTTTTRGGTSSNSTKQSLARSW